MTVHITEQLANTVYGLHVPLLTWEQKRRARRAICTLAGRGLDITDDAQRPAPHQNQPRTDNEEGH